MPLEQAGADALVMINSFGPCLSIDLETGLPLMGSKEGFGWLSGAAIKPLALRCVYDAARVVKIPIFGVGGITNGRDVAEMFMAGASAVQVCTEAILRGPTIYGKIAQELNTFLDSHGYAIGRRDQGPDHSQDGGTRRAEGRERRLKWIWSGAIFAACARSVARTAPSRQDEVLKIDEEKCFTCGLCVSRCKRARSDHGAVSVA